MRWLAGITGKIDGGDALTDFVNGLKSVATIWADATHLRLALPAGLQSGVYQSISGKIKQSFNINLTLSGCYLFVTVTNMRTCYLLFFSLNQIYNYQLWKDPEK